MTMPAGNPMNSNDIPPTPYQVVAAIIKSEKPDMWLKINAGARLAISTLLAAMPEGFAEKDLEPVFSLIGYIMSDLLTTPGHDLSEKLDLTFDTYSLAAGAVAGEIDLDGAAEAKDMEQLLEEAKRHAEATGHDKDTGLYL